MTIFSFLSICLCQIFLFHLVICSDISTNETKNSPYFSLLQRLVASYNARKFSEEVEDFCASDPCQNGGTCFSINDDSQCLCKEGFKGDLCEIGPNNPCIENPCKNGGECAAKGGSYKCYCVDPYYGDRCEDVRSPCNPNPCQNNGSCQIENESTKCKCGELYLGKFCEKALCSPNPCLNNGECVVKDENATCLCKKPYWGEFCEKDFCSSNPCKNDGICMTINNERKCVCKPYSSGEFCEIGPCFPNPCQNNGSCRIIDGRSQCTCLEPYSGMFCEKREGDGNSSSSPSSVVEATTLAVCNCGEKSTHCYHDVRFKKVCICLPGYEEKEGICSECYCGMQSWSCRFSSRGDKFCDCKPGYAQKNGTCVELCMSSSDCRKKGICKRFDRGSFCDCGPYFSGDRCEKSGFCDLLKEKCEEIGAVCVPTRWKTKCECPEGKMFTPRGMCEDICDSAKCLFGKCEVTGKAYRCICERGFSGFLCDINNNIKTNVSILGISLVVFCFFLLVILVGILCCYFQNIRYKKCDETKHC